MSTVRLSEVLSSRVVSADGESLGRVVDVRLVQDGPLLESFGAALRLEALIVGRGGIGVRLGYGRRDMTGPWLLQQLCRRMERRAHLVPMEEVDSMEEGTIRLKLPGSEVRQLHEI
jgi:hypothetical protein